MSLHEKLDRMIDLNPFFPQIKRLLKMDSEYREYGIELLKATLKFEVKNISFGISLFNEEGDDLISLKINNGEISTFKPRYDRQVIREQLLTRNKSWTAADGMFLRYTPDVVAIHPTYSYSKMKIWMSGIQYHVKSSTTQMFFENEGCSTGVYTIDTKKNYYRFHPSDPEEKPETSFFPMSDFIPV